MKLKLVLFALFLSGSILAQETIKSLVITEARLNNQIDTYIEITNMDDESVNLKDFKLGNLTPWNMPVNNVFKDPWITDKTRYFMLPDFVLKPGKSFVVTLAYDFGPEQYAKKTLGFEKDQLKPQKTQMYELANLLIHAAEPKGDATDSITMNTDSVDISWTLENYEGRSCLYIEQHFSNGDSLVIDQVGGVFDNDGRNRMQGNFDVAGVTGATGNAILVRKFSVKKGNPDFANARGVGEDDSEWIPLRCPPGWSNGYRDVFWTVGNHGDFKLDKNTLESEIADIEFESKTITVPWGTRRADGVMHLMKKKPGIAWYYDLNANYDDSLTFAARSGDKLTVVLCGDKSYKATFNIVVSEPTVNAKIVVPVTSFDYPAAAVQNWRNHTQEGILAWPRVTEHTSGPDTITGNWYGIPYATSVDTLLKRLEKPSNAKWKIVPVDGIARPELKHGDKLKVTAQSGMVKEYFIEVQPLQKSHNAYMSSITWPDIPAQYKGIFGWMGDTIPGFTGTTYNYRISVPADVPGIPALVAKSADLNAKIKVKRATSLQGTVADRTISFEVTAEDDSIQNFYNVELVKEKDPAKMQPYFAEPFVSEFVFRDQWWNSFGEIANPGNQPLDLSNYMIVSTYYTNQAKAISSGMGTTEWLDRYHKYVPGHKWVNEAQWAVTPGILERDLNVNAIVMPGDVFCFGSIINDSFTNPSWLPDYKWPVPAQLDIQFNTDTANYNKRDFPNGYSNPWNETLNVFSSPIHAWLNSSWYMFKILNDSIQQGLKPANDPNDFELIETWSMPAFEDWVIGGKKAEMITNWMRKPHIYKGNTGFGTNGSFGTNPDDCEWTYTDMAYWLARNETYPLFLLNISNNIGQHFMHEPTQYKSTVTSVVYKVSEGYSLTESILGMKTGTTVASFLEGIIKDNEKQTLKVKRATIGEMALDAVLMLNDTLVVLSADSTNTTKYVLNVSDEGLSSNAVITSARYTVTIELQPKNGANENAGVGKIQGFDYGTTLRTILANIKVPSDASLSAIYGNGAYVPLKILNFDTAYVNVTVNDNIYLSVIAENGITEIIYQLIPAVSDNDAFVLSDVYGVVQKDFLIQYVPRGTRAGTFKSNLFPSAGATMKVVNKMGQERTDGDVADDDKVIITSKNGSVTKTYYISKLSSAATPQTLYLAYILSDVYAVDQVIYTVDGVSGSETISAFLSKVSPAAGASVAVVDKTGALKLNGDIDGSDKVLVTSADGKMKVYYTFGPLTSIGKLESDYIELFPNPTSVEINVSGVKAGQRIQVYNSAGMAISYINVQNSIERISLRNQPAGMYMIVVRDNNKMLGNYKVLKK